MTGKNPERILHYMDWESQTEKVKADSWCNKILAQFKIAKQRLMKSLNDLGLQEEIDYKTTDCYLALYEKAFSAVQWNERAIKNYENYTGILSTLVKRMRKVNGGNEGSCTVYNFPVNIDIEEFLGSLDKTKTSIILTPRN